MESACEPSGGRYNTEWLIERLGHRTRGERPLGDGDDVTDEMRSHDGVGIDDRRGGALLGYPSCVSRNPVQSDLRMTSGTR